MVVKQNPLIIFRVYLYIANNGQICPCQIMNNELLLSFKGDEDGIVVEKYVPKSMEEILNNAMKEIW